MNSSILSIKRIWKIIKKTVYTQSITVFEGNIMQLMSKVMKKRCNERLMTEKSNSIGRNRSGSLLALMSLPMMKMTLYTDNGLELHPASLSLVRKSIFTKENVGVPFARE